MKCPVPADGVASCTGGTCGFTCQPSYVPCGGGCCPKYKTVFVTSQLYDGALGGVAGGDSKCQALADAQSLYGKYMAWLSEGANPSSPSARMTHATVPYRLVNGTLVASDWNALTNTASVYFNHAIDTTEQGGPAPVGTACSGAAIDFTGTTSVPVWSNTLSDGTFNGLYSYCPDANGGWSSNTAQLVRIGDATAIGIRWSQACFGNARVGGPSPCGQTAALYCIQQ
jgi:hypothetical protein